MRYPSRTQRPRKYFPPLPTRVCTTRYGNQVAHWKSTAELVIIKTEPEVQFFNAVSILTERAFALSCPCQQAFVPPATATTLCIGRATSHF